MHRVATLSGELDHERKFETISQNPSEILFISTADTELAGLAKIWSCLLYTSPSPRDYAASRMPSSA